jgi:hypothetical protein
VPAALDYASTVTLSLASLKPVGAPTSAAVNVFLGSQIFPDLWDLVLQHINLSGSTYICEKIFSVTNLAKNEQYTALTDYNLHDMRQKAT